ncbi:MULTISPECIES: C39 family peptidase [Kitasatospora]|uniref:C39 family peptidase n=1 Tax=Kitasatospora cathayae TaxID=3004092 RepID=A0ABY7PYB0_9ACTN|nr:C39 family peptidase [Kitasatospora sp. HUAS 3-15]WBP85361.1 C39 family peptidase [Kitasatospora sp. HUAS 3-15]
MAITARARASWLAVLTTATLAAGTGPARGAPGTLDDVSVPYYHQQLSDDCEAAALRMVLAARGVDADDQQILDRIGVDREHPEFGHSGPRSGDPYRAFVGDPNGSETGGTGFGVYHPPVAGAARSYGLTVLQDDEGVSVQELKDHLAAGHPAIVWVDYLWRHLATTTYTAYDGRSIPYAGPAEHTVVVTGFSGGNVSLNDPARGRTTVSEQDFADGYATYGQMAVVIG